MVSEVVLNFEHEAELYDQEADAIAGEAVYIDRQADIAFALAEVKHKEAALEPDESKARSLRFDGEAARKEAEIFKQILRALIAARERAVARAQTARQKCEIARTAPGGRHPSRGGKHSHASR